MITDAKGSVYQHLEYFPFGETWIDEGKTPTNIPGYQFTGKELDPETGLYYFGARYYEPVISRWISADPIFGKYLPVEINDKDLPGRGGVFNAVNLNLYAYGQLSPLKNVDPDGKLSLKAYRVSTQDEYRFEITFSDDKIESTLIEKGVAKILGSAKVFYEKGKEAYTKIAEYLGGKDVSYSKKGNETIQAINEAITDRKFEKSLSKEDKIAFKEGQASEKQVMDFLHKIEGTDEFKKMGYPKAENFVGEAKKSADDAYIGRGINVIQGKNQAKQEPGTIGEAFHNYYINHQPLDQLKNE